jgi:putative exosortase-associated protein (TIGR04073 family)
MKKIVVCAAIISFLFASPVFAKDVWELAESENYGEKFPGMLGRGLLNVVTCPVDIPVQLVKGAREDDHAFMGAVGGFATGAMCTVLRAASGIVDVAFSWAPGFNGVPVSRSYEDCLASNQRPGSASIAAPYDTNTSQGWKTTSPSTQSYQPPPPRVVQQQTTPVPSTRRAASPPSTTTEGQMKYIKK